jgi:lysozyme
MRRINEAGLSLIKSFEGLFLKPYLCPANVPTIGYGTIKYPNGKAVSIQDPAITEKQALEFLEHEVNEKSAAVERLVKVDISDNEFAALVSFSYNVGIGALQKSTLLRRLNANEDRSKVAEEFLRWNRAGGKVLAGLTRRRQAEKALFLQPNKESKKNDDKSDFPSEKDIEVTLKEIEDKILKS